MSNLVKSLRKLGREKRSKEDAHHRTEGLVSVCIPNYNKAEFLEEALRSILEQTYPMIELIFVDDCSSDGSVKVFEDFRSKHENNFYKVKAYYSPVRLGNAWAQNIAYYLSKGQFIANMDSDDVSMSTRISTQVQMILDEDLALAGSNFSIFKQSWTSPEIASGGYWLKFGKEEILDSYLIDQIHCICFGTCLFTAEVLERTGGLNKEFIGTEDWDFVNRVAGKGFPMGNTREVLYAYRSHKNQRSKLFHDSSV